MDRDIKSAICIRDYSLRNSGQTVPLEQGEYTPLEMKTTTDMLKYLKSIENITASLIKKKEKFLEAHELHS